MPTAAHKGAIAFGLVYIPVALYTAVSEQGISFNQLHKDSLSRIKYKKVRADNGDEIAPDEIVKGYEYEKDRYVVLSEQEIEAMKTPKDKAITILHFAPAGTIDPIYFEKPYYVAPEGSDKAFSLLRDAMTQNNVIAVARTVLGTRETLMALMPSDDGIMAVTLHYQSEIRPVVKSASRAEISQVEREMGNMLVRSMTGVFQPEQYHDEFERKLRDAIARKIEGQDVATPTPAQETGVADLMDALKRSVEQRQGQPEPAGVR